MYSVKFQPIHVAGKRVHRPLVQQILDDVRPLTLVSAPRGFGKSALALQVYEQASGERLWVNAGQYADSHEWSLSLLQDIAVRLNLDTTTDAVHGSFEEKIQLWIQIIADALNARQGTFLLVIDGICHAQSRILLRAFVDISALIASRHRVVLTVRQELNECQELLRGSPSCRVVTATQLKFTNAEVADLVPMSLRNQFDLMHLLERCHGWPALVGFVLREYQPGKPVAELEQQLLHTIHDSVKSYFSAEFISSVAPLSQITQFDESLFRAFDQKIAGYVSRMVVAGFIEQTDRFGFEFHYRWSCLVQQVLQAAVSEHKETLFARLRLLAWADSQQRWSDSLYLALAVDTPEAIRHRLVATGRRIQESGQALLLRKVLTSIRWEADLASDDSLELLFIDLAAYCMRPVAILADKIHHSYQILEQLPVAKQRIYATWVECVEAQLAMRESATERAQALVPSIRNHVNELPPYYRAQAYSVLGELSLIDGELSQATEYFSLGADIAERDRWPSSLLWHKHQLAQVYSLAGQTTLAEQIRFTAIQLAREMNATNLFPYRCLMRAHCECLLNELRVREVEPFLRELEQASVLLNDNDALSINLIRLEFHRLSCLLDGQYRSDIQNTVGAIERALLHRHHPHVVVRAERNLLNFWYQSEQIHLIAQWYRRQSIIGLDVAGPDQLIHLRNLVFAHLVLQDFDILADRKWVLFTAQEMRRWLRCWPSLAPAPVFLLALDESVDDPVQSREWMSLALGMFSQSNTLAEPLAYHSSWLEPLQQNEVPLQRYQATFMSRLNAIWGNRVKYSIVRDADEQPNSAAHVGLSPREWQLLQNVAQGMSNETIAEHLNLSVGTVKNQLTKIYRKLGVTGRGAARSRYKSFAESA